VVVVVVAVLPLEAAIKVRESKVNSLKIGGKDYGGSWRVSSPTLWSYNEFGYLSYDASGKSPKVSFRLLRGSGSNWQFLEMRSFEYTRRGGTWWSSNKNDVEVRGCTMKLRASTGPFKGWYLGREDGELVLVKDESSAVTLRLVLTETEYTHR
jgi:hypothetical protein